METDERGWVYFGGDQGVPRVGSGGWNREEGRREVVSEGHEGLWVVRSILLHTVSE